MIGCQLDPRSSRPATLCIQSACLPLFHINLSHKFPCGQWSYFKETLESILNSWIQEVVVGLLQLETTNAIALPRLSRSSSDHGSPRRPLLCRIWHMLQYWRRWSHYDLHGWKIALAVLPANFLKPADHHSDTMVHRYTQQLFTQLSECLDLFWVVCCPCKSRTTKPSFGFGQQSDGRSIEHATNF